MSESMRKQLWQEETVGYCCQARRDAMKHSPDTLGQVTGSIMYLAIERRNVLAVGAARPVHADLPTALVCPFCGQGIQQWQFSSFLSTMHCHSRESGNPL